MKKIQTRYMHESLFCADICLVVCEWKHLLEGANRMLPKDRQDEFKNSVEKHGERPATLAVQFPIGEGGGSIIWALPNAKMSTLVHEATHAAHHLLKQRDVPLSDDTEEVYAYLVERIFKGLLI